MGVCFSAPDRARDGAVAGMMTAGRVLVGSLEASAAAAAKATRMAKLAKYALVGCAFDADTAARARRLEALRDMLFDQIALYKGWAATTVAMDYAVLMHWGKHCRANESCAARLRDVSLKLQNAAAAHEAYVEHIKGPFISGLDKAIDRIEEAWHVYEDYEKAEYDYRYALKSTKDEAKHEVKRAEVEVALKEAKKAIDTCAKVVENDMLVPVYTRAIEELSKLAKKCGDKVELKGEQQREFLAKFERANSVAYEKIRKRTYTAGEVASAAIKAVRQSESGLEESFKKINVDTEEMKRHGVVFALSLQDFLPYIKIIFGPEKSNVFAEQLIKKIDGYASLKKVAAELNDKIAVLTSEINVDELKTLMRQLDSSIRQECGRVSAHADEYVKAVAAIAQAEKNLIKVEEVNKAADAKVTVPPAEKIAREKFLAEKQAREDALTNAREEIPLAKERAQADLNAHAEVFDEMFIKKDCIFAQEVLLSIEKVCAVVTDSHKRMLSIKTRVISDKAEDPDPVEEVVVPQTETTHDEVDFEKAAAELERKVAIAEKKLEEESKKQADVQNALDLERAKSIKKSLSVRASFKEKQESDFERLVEEIAVIEVERNEEQQPASAA